MHEQQFMQLQIASKALYHHFLWLQVVYVKDFKIFLLFDTLPQW